MSLLQFLHPFYFSILYLFIYLFFQIKTGSYWLNLFFSCLSPPRLFVLFYIPNHVCRGFWPSLPLECSCDVAKITAIQSGDNGRPWLLPFTVPLAFFSSSPPLQLRTDAEKRSLVESGLSWYSEDGKVSHKLSSSAYETGSLKTEAPSKWRKKPPSLSEEAAFRGELKKPQSLGHPGAFKKGRNPPVGVTSPITHTSQTTLKVAGEICTVFSRKTFKIAAALNHLCNTAQLHVGQCLIS